MKLEQLLLWDEMIKEIHLEKLCIRIYSKIIQLIKIYTEDCIHTIFHFLTNVIWFIILSSYSILDNFFFLDDLILDNEELVIPNPWIQEFLYNLSNTIKVLVKTISLWILCPLIKMIKKKTGKRKSLLSLN